MKERIRKIRETLFIAIRFSISLNDKTERKKTTPIRQSNTIKLRAWKLKVLPLVRIIFGYEGELASKNRSTEFYQNQLYVVKGFWKMKTWGDNNDRHENVLYITDIQTL